MAKVVYTLIINTMSCISSIQHREGEKRVDSVPLCML